MSTTAPSASTAACPLPAAPGPLVERAHGGGGRRARVLLETLFAPAFASPEQAVDTDAALLDLPAPGRLALTTDSFVVDPLFFPGGDIGRLAVYGTVNDLAVSGARPLWLAAGFIVEEGLPLETLRRVVDAMAEAAREANVRVVTGDTKVVPRGQAGGGLFINTTGVGLAAPGCALGPAAMAPGDVVLLSGDVGRHGVAVMSVREGLAFETPLVSDCAPLDRACAALLQAGIPVRVMRDLTRGGLASALVELAEASGLGLLLDEAAVPVSAEVGAACELLGLDPLHVACEGRFVAVVAADEAARALTVLRPHAPRAACVGSVTSAHPRLVVARTALGTERVVDMLSGEQLPRIC